MRLNTITPLILTWNEAPNISRCLAQLSWADEIIVIDSGSTDETLEICASVPNVKVVHREFDSFAGQCNFGLSNLSTPWALSIDADYILPASFPECLLALDSESKFAGYRSSFRYCIHGRPLRSTLYPPRTVLYQIDKANYVDDGHGHKVEIDGSIENLGETIDHDDHKPLERWLNSQQKYTKLEAAKLYSASPADLSLQDRLRKMIWPAAPAAFLYTLFVKGLIFDGWPGWAYSLQRTYAEILLSLEMLETKLRKS